MNLKNTMLSQRTNTQNLKYYKILPIRKIHSRQIHRDRQDIGCGSGSGQRENCGETG